MGRRTAVGDLPPEVRAWLERALAEGNFTGYKALEDTLRGQGFQISKSAIHKYGQKMERRFAAIKASTEAARMITEGASDDQDARSEAVIALIQTELFNGIVDMQEANDPDLDPLSRMDLMSKVAKNIASLTSASIAQKKYKSAVAQRAADVAEKAAKIASQGGLSAATVAEIRRSILGIAS